MLGAVAIGLAAFIFRPVPPRPEGSLQGISTWRLVLASSPIAAPGVLEFWGHAVGHEPAPAPLFAASVALAALVFVRLHRFVGSNMRVRARLRSRERHFRALAANSSDAVVVVDPDGVLRSGRTSLANQRLQLELDLAGAEDRGELRLVYQPVIELDTDRIVSLEALVRWEHPALGLLSPDRFVPLPEDPGMIIPIGRWVLETACTTLAARHRTPGGSDLTMAVNVSARQLASDTFVADVATALSRSGLKPASLVLEMTETALVRGLLDLATTLDLETIAEGVELEVQRDHLRSSNCAMAQGYLFARPMTREDADASVAGMAAPVDAVRG